MESSEQLRICYNYFHVPGVDEKSQFRKGVVDSVSRELEQISVHLGSPTICFGDKESLTNFLLLNPKLKILKSTMSHDFFIGEIALICGWYLALNRFLDSSHDLLIMFEDDLWFNTEQSQGVSRLNSIIENLPGDLDILFLYSPEECFGSFHLDLEINEYICEHFSNYSTAFTLITRDGAQKTLAAFEVGIDRCLDAFLMFATPLNRYCLKPDMQASSFSVYQRQWIGSIIDPRMGQVPTIYITEQDLP
jgi:hypothetical protein